MVTIEIDGTLPAALGLSRPRLRAAARFFAAKAAALAGREFRAVSIILQDDEASDAAHQAVMGIAGATDVITQPLDALPGEPAGVYGELYVNCTRALTLAKPRWSAARELLLYVAHGFDHLAGSDDRSPAQYRRMRRRELRWLKEFHQGEIK